MATNAGKPRSGAAKKAAKRAPAKKKTAAKSPAEKKTSSQAHSSLQGPAEEVRAIPSVSGIQASIASRTTRGVRNRDVTAFLRQLIMMLEAGTPILRALNSLANRGERQAIRKLVKGIAEHVESGNPLWQAFAREDKYFPPVFINLIKAAEASGTLTTVLRRLVENRERREMMRKRVQGAMIYPAVLVTACFGLLVIIAKIIIPIFEDIFVDFGIELSNFTLLLVNLSNLLSAYWWVFIVVVVGIVAAYRLWWLQSPVRRTISDRLKLRIPIIGPILRRNTVIDFCRTFAMLLRGGLSMMATLDLCRASVANKALSNAVQDMRDSVERGDGLEPPLRSAERSGIFPGVIVDMLVTGEETGSMDKVADQVADAYEEEVEIAVNTLGEAITPIFTVFMGAIVLLIAFAMFGPLLQMMEQLGGGGI